MDQLIFASLSHTHYWYEVGMLKVPAVIQQHGILAPGTLFSYCRLKPLPLLTFLMIDAPLIIRHVGGTDGLSISFVFQGVPTGYLQYPRKHILCPATSARYYSTHTHRQAESGVRYL